MVRCVRDWGCLREHTTLYLSCILHILHSSTPLPYHCTPYLILFITNLHISTLQLYLITALLSAHSSPTFLTTVLYYVAPHSPTVLRCTRTVHISLHSVSTDTSTAYFTKPSLPRLPTNFINSYPAVSHNCIPRCLVSTNSAHFLITTLLSLLNSHSLCSSAHSHLLTGVH